jgi:hypothetical protein
MQASSCPAAPLVHGHQGSHRLLTSPRSAKEDAASLTSAPSRRMWKTGPSLRTGGGRVMRGVVGVEGEMSKGPQECWRHCRGGAAHHPVKPGQPRSSPVRPLTRAAADLHGGVHRDDVVVHQRPRGVGQEGLGVALWGGVRSNRGGVRNGDEAAGREPLRARRGRRRARAANSPTTPTPLPQPVPPSRAHVGHGRRAAREEAVAPQHLLPRRAAAAVGEPLLRAAAGAALEAARPALDARGGVAADDLALRWWGSGGWGRVCTRATARWRHRHSLLAAAEMMRKQQGLTPCAGACLGAPTAPVGGAAAPRKSHQLPLALPPSTPHLPLPPSRPPPPGPHAPTAPAGSAAARRRSPPAPPPRPPATPPPRPAGARRAQAR